MIQHFGNTETGEAVQAVTLSNGTLTARVLSFGGILQDLRMAGHPPSLVLGFDNFSPYVVEGGYIGATVGRFANRIADGHLEIDGTVYQLDQNFQNQHTLHGGRFSIGKQTWDIIEQGSAHVRFALTLPDGHMGFPGRLQITLDWRLNWEGVLSCTLKAKTDAPTVCNLAHHSYFNLTGRPDMTGHMLQIIADNYLPVNDDLIPTGEICPVERTAYDFRHPQKLPANLPLDLNFCLSSNRQKVRPVAKLSTQKGPSLEVSTTEPGLQIYDGANLSTKMKGLNGFSYGPFAGLAIEAQLWPDAPHHRHFPNALLRPDEVYEQRTEFKIST